MKGVDSLVTVPKTIPPAYHSATRNRVHMSSLRSAVKTPPPIVIPANRGNTTGGQAYLLVPSVFRDSSGVPPVLDDRSAMSKAVPGIEPGKNRYGVGLSAKSGPGSASFDEGLTCSGILVSVIGSRKRAGLVFLGFVPVPRLSNRSGDSDAVFVYLVGACNAALVTQQIDRVADDLGGVAVHIFRDWRYLRGFISKSVQIVRHGSMAPNWAVSAPLVSLVAGRVPMACHNM